MKLAIANAKARLVTLLHKLFWFLLCSSSWLKTLLTKFTTHNSRLTSFPGHVGGEKAGWYCCLHTHD